MKKILFAAFAALSMIACNKDDATTVIPDIDNTLNGAIVAMPKWAGNPIVVSIICGIVHRRNPDPCVLRRSRGRRSVGKIPLLALRVRVQRQR